MENMTCSSLATQCRDFGGGSCGCLELVFSFLAMVFLFVFGVKALGLGWEDVVGESREKSNNWRHGFCSFAGSRPVQGRSCDKKEDNHCFTCESHRRPRLYEQGDEGSGGFEEILKEEALELKTELMVERERRREASLELENERQAAASSLESAMTMILKLQNEMSTVKLEARQYRELVKEKQNHDREVIEYLKWIIWHAESGRDLCADELKVLDEMTAAESVSIENRGTGDESLIGRRQGKSIPTNCFECEDGNGLDLKSLCGF